MLTPNQRRCFDYFGVAPPDWMVTTTRLFDTDEALRVLANHLPLEAVPLALPPCKLSELPPFPQLPATPPPHVRGDQRQVYQLSAARTCYIDGDRIQSGLFNEPCGAGKTKLALTIIRYLRTTACVIVPERNLASQWSAAATEWNIPNYIIQNDAVGGKNGRRPRCFAPHPDHIIILTYKLLAEAMQKDVKNIKNDALIAATRIWKYGVVFFDEGHSVMAETYLEAASRLRCHARYGLSALFERLDHKDVATFIGPIIHKMTREEAIQKSIIIDVKRSVRIVPTTPAFDELYARTKSAEHRTWLSVINPYKIAYLLQQLRHTTSRTVIVFCDKIELLDYVIASIEMHERTFDMYACKDPDQLSVVAGKISGTTSPKERQEVCRRLNTWRCSIAVFSRTGNKGIDIQRCDETIEITVTDRSSQECVQRVGRAQRTCDGKMESNMTTILTQKTREVDFYRERIDPSDNIEEIVVSDIKIPASLRKDVDCIFAEILKRKRDVAHASSSSSLDET